MSDIASAREGEEGERGRQHQAARERAPPLEDERAEPRRGEHQAERRGDRHQPRGPGRDAERLHGGRHQPVAEDRLVEERLALVARDHPVARLDHPARGVQEVDLGSREPGHAQVGSSSAEARAEEREPDAEARRRRARERSGVDGQGAQRPS